MCDRLILDGQAYICNSCWEELLEYKKQWPKNMFERTVRAAIEYFMYKTGPGKYLGMDSLNAEQIDREFERLTSLTVVPMYLD
jgi:hypothetical protein